MPRVVAQGLDGEPITTSDSTTYEPVLQALYVGTGGTVVYTNINQEDITLTNVPNGAWLPIRATKVKTGTTASDIVGFY